MDARNAELWFSQRVVFLFFLREEDRGSVRQAVSPRQHKLGQNLTPGNLREKVCSAGAILII